MLISINGGTPKWMVYDGTSKKMDENWGYLNSGNHQRISDLLISDVLQIRSPKWKLTLVRFTIQAGGKFHGKSSKNMVKNMLNMHIYINID